MLALAATFTAFAAPALAHDGVAVNNKALNVPGFPDCVSATPDATSGLSVEEAADHLVCHQNKVFADSIKIGCVGDSITAGAHSSGAAHTYPSVLQANLDAKYGEGVYEVTNLGACGSTMTKNGDSPYWQRDQYTTLTASDWDIVTIMLGTNDAKDPSSGHAYQNWNHDCGGPDATTTSGCSFAEDYADMISVVAGLGDPKIYVMTPPPLMQQGAYGMNQTVINDVFPALLPLIQADNANALESGPIDVFSALGGEGAWRDDYPTSCALDTETPESCAWYCDSQSCDQCHPNDDGYVQLAAAVQKGLGL